MGRVDVNVDRCLYFVAAVDFLASVGYQALASQALRRNYRIFCFRSALVSRLPAAAISASNRVRPVAAR